jgi:hypothetical protein
MQFDSVGRLSGGPSLHLVYLTYLDWATAFIPIARGGELSSTSMHYLPPLFQEKAD